MNTQWFNPVKVLFACEDLSPLKDLVSGRQAFLITTSPFADNGVVDWISDALGTGLQSVFSEVGANPTIASITDLASRLDITASSVVIALGGGSVIDTAKGVCAIKHLGTRSDDWLSRHLRDGEPFPDDFCPVSSIAIPTTSGTGAEATMWATIWDEITGVKRSLAHPELYPESAVLSPALTATLPEDMTIFTALDAMSHSMESIWSLSTNPVSEALSSRSIRLVVQNLHGTIEAPGNIELRARLQQAALFGGMAISGTRTALAHSISYPLTATFGMPHGLACSFTLPELFRLNADGHPDMARLIVSALGVSSEAAAIDLMYRFFATLSLDRRVKKYIGDKNLLSSVKGKLITPGRAENNLVALKDAEAFELLEAAYTFVTRK